MNLFLRTLTVLLALLPLLAYLGYSLRRLDARRSHLLRTLLTMDLADYYMRIRHYHEYERWIAKETDKRLLAFETDYFNPDFRAGNSRSDFALPVTLMTLLTGVGWLFALARVDPLAGGQQLHDLVPPTLVWGFVGAYFASMLLIVEESRKYSLTPNTYYSLVYRILFSSTAALLVSGLFPDTFSALTAFGIGLFPVEKTRDFIMRKTSELVGSTTSEGELGAELAVIQGLADGRNRRRLVDVGITSVQALATADPLVLFLETTLPIRTIIDMIDKSILYLYIGDKVEELRTHGINGVIELVALARLIEAKPAYADDAGAGGARHFNSFFGDLDGNQLMTDVATVLGQSIDELRAFIYNMYYDPVVVFIYDVWGRYLKVDAAAQA